MESIDFSTFEEFKIIRREMNIQDKDFVDFNMGKVFSQTDWQDPPLREGITIPADDDSVEYKSNGIFYAGKRVLLYIRDQSYQYYKSENSGYKFHIADCRTLLDMRQKKRYSRYVVSNDTSGIVRINLIENNKVVEKKNVKMCVCKNCLQVLDWKKYSQANKIEKNLIYENFSLEEFFAYYKNGNEGSFATMPMQSSDNAPINRYPDDWQELSKRLRHLNNDRCTKCGRIIKEAGKLHVHHINGNKYDNNLSNLLVLCANCHQKEHPEHKILNSDVWNG